MDDIVEYSWASQVIDFWFVEIAPKDWFKKSDATDNRIRERFLNLHQDISTQRDGYRPRTPREVLAAVIVLDQFSRNMFRGTARAYGFDSMALSWARWAVDQQYDRLMSKSERQFLYLPFEHSESSTDQERSVALMSALEDEELTRYALAHKAAIDRFGRFPHRNAILGRETTVSEAEFLASPMSSF